MRVLGIDPGSKVTGFGVVQRDRSEISHVAHGNLELTRSLTLAGKLDQLHRLVLEVIERHAPDVAVVEEVFMPSATSPRSALVLGQARGAIMAAIGAAGIAVFEYAPATIKQSVTGSGRANKSQMKSMVRRVLDLDTDPAGDAADALAAAICHAQAGRLATLEAIQRPRKRTSRRSSRVAVRRVR
ncbi:crossover junction endodeoxyribonuclease RuvC [Myxococcota bacterium]|nr:crossover junction endodeoxyribonuclease RuvC [Myxococcota bacterium]